MLLGFASCVVVLLVQTVAAAPAPAELDFPYHAQLDPNYDLFWIFNASHIEFKVVVNTTGYFGFGISENGKMFPADIVVGWVKNGKPHLLDGYTTSHALPPQDHLGHRNDWHLVSGSEENGVTTFTFWRLLNTCDGDDFAIEEGTTRVIWSYHAQDIDTTQGAANPMSYHGPTQRGTKSLLLLDPPTSESPIAPLSANVKTLDFLNKNVSVPNHDTYYHCTTFNLPDLGGKHHMIRYEPIIQAGHVDLVHHILVYYCPGTIDPSMGGREYECYEERPPQLHDCHAVMISWATGGQAFNFPDTAGYPLGSPADPKFLIMETHYNNPGRRTDFVDNSGIRVVLTTELRAHDAGILEAGSLVNKNLAVPPHSQGFLSTGYCTQECLAEGVGDGDIHVFANMLHSHLAGRSLRTRVVRNGQELAPLAQDKHYDFDYQEMRTLVNEYTLKKGDSLIVECLYKTQDRNQPTYGGLATTNEMCLSFLLYWPRMPLTNCMSQINYNKPGGIQHYLNSIDWSQQSSHDDFQNVTNNAQVRSRCIGDQSFSSSYKYYPQQVLQPAASYIAPNACDIPN